MLKKRTSSVVMLVLAAMACTKNDPTFLITETSVGSISNGTTLNLLEELLPNDSIVRDTMQSNVRNTLKKVKIYEKGGMPLMLLTAANDSLKTIENIQVLDPRFSAENGISLRSTFKDIQEKYTIKKIVTTLNSLVIFPKESNLYFTIDKTELPYNLRFNQPNIEAVQIPDEAKIKYLMIGWN